MSVIIVNTVAHS